MGCSAALSQAAAATTVRATSSLPRSPTGTKTYGDTGDKYVGEYKDGKRPGLGKYTFANGQVYHDGEWENDQAKK